VVKVLVTYGWCRTAYLSVQALATLGYEVYSCSHLQPSMSGWSRFCHGSAPVSDPFKAPISFIEDISRLVDRWQIDVLLPVHEDALVLRREEKDLPYGIRIASSDFTSLCIGVNKRTITEHAQNIGISVPRTIFPNTIDDAIELAPSLGFPLVIKLTRSNSAKGVLIVSTKAELQKKLYQLCVDFPNGFIGDYLYLQAFQHGRVVGGCFMSRDGNIDGYFGEQYLRTKTGSMGTSVFREPFKSPELESLVKKIVASLKWSGIGHFDFIQDCHTGEFFLLEMNPRPWGAINLAYVNGFDFIGALISYTLGEKDLTRFFRPKQEQSIRSMWILGEMIRIAYLVKSRQLDVNYSTPSAILNSLKNTHFDDFLWNDPLPFLAESLCYAKGFINSNGNLNPT